MSMRRHVPNNEASVVFVSLPAGERVPPLIFRLVTRCRNARSAALLSGGTSGSRTKTNNSCICPEIRYWLSSHSVRWEMPEGVKVLSLRHQRPCQMQQLACGGAPGHLHRLARLP